MRFEFYSYAQDFDGLNTKQFRYARVGNCDMGSHLKEDGTIDWQTPMLEDVSHSRLIVG